MKTGTRLLAVFILWMCAVPWVHASESEMLHVIIRNSGSNIPEDSFVRAPKEIWRVGFQKMRLEEAHNPGTGVHGLIIVDEPNIYMINRNENSGQHYVDSGPVLEIHMPVFPSETSDVLNKLEFGNEVEFFQQHNAKRLPSTELNGKRQERFRLDLDGARLVILVDEATGHPTKLSMNLKGTTFDLLYDLYEPGLKPDPSLFKVPGGIKIVKGKQ